MVDYQTSTVGSGEKVRSLEALESMRVRREVEGWPWRVCGQHKLANNPSTVFAKRETLPVEIVGRWGRV